MVFMYSSTLGAVAVQAMVTPPHSNCLHLGVGNLSLGWIFLKGSCVWFWDVPLKNSVRIHRSFSKTFAWNVGKYLVLQYSKSCSSVSVDVWYFLFLLMPKMFFILAINFFWCPHFIKFFPARIIPSLCMQFGLQFIPSLLIVDMLLAIWTPCCGILFLNSSASSPPSGQIIIFYFFWVIWHGAFVITVHFDFLPVAGRRSIEFVSPPLLTFR